VLGVKQVGIKDNFFELGGDSIKAIRFTTLCKNQGYDISIKDLMKKGTVIELEQFLMNKKYKNETNRKYEKIDKIPMSPLLKEFISNNLKDSTNLCHMLFLEVKEFDEIIIDALNSVVKIHPMLRVEYRDGKLKVINGFNYGVPKYDLRRYDDKDKLKQQIINLCKRVQISLINMEGLLFKAILIRTRTKDYLFLCGHKVVIDSWSLKIVTQEIRRNYNILCKGRKNLDIKENTSYLNYIKTLESMKNDKNVLVQLDYWLQIAKRSVGSKLEPDKNDEENTFYGMEFSIKEKETRALLHLSESVLGMKINEVLLGVFAIATKKLTGQRSVSVTYVDKGRNRDKVSDNLDGIGTYEIKYPIVLPTYGENETDILCDVKRDLDYIPDNGIGYGWLSLEHNNLKEKLQTTVLFHSLDKTELEEKNLTINGSQDITEREILKNNYIHEKIAFYSSYKNNKISFYIEFDESKFSKNMINSFAKYYLKALIKISKKCLKYEKKDILLLDTGIKNIRDIHKGFLEELKYYGKNIVEEKSTYKYEPSFSQKIFLDDIIGGGSSGRFEIQGEYRIEEVIKAILRIITEQSVLRTQYLKEENMLIEYKSSMDHRIPIIDISNNKNQGESQIYAMVEKMGLDTSNLLKGPLLNKICIIRVSESKYVVYIFIHHALWDMTSSSIFERRLNQLLKDCKLYSKRENLHEYSQIIQSINVEDNFKNIKFNEFIKAANGMQLFYKNKSKMTVFKEKYSEDIVNSKVMTDQLSTMLKLLEFIITQEPNMKSVNKIPVIILHHGRNSNNRSSLGLFQEPKFFVVDVNDLNRHTKVSEFLANSPEKCLGAKDLSKEQQKLLNNIGRRIPSINAVTSYGDDSGITAERILDSNIKKIMGSIISFKVPISVRCQFADDGVIITVTGFRNRKEEILNAMNEIIIYGDIDRLTVKESMNS
ncbi:condensation domain-containing protein, partial [Senegalia sp. (in: firmicutes)]